MGNPLTHKEVLAYASKLAGRKIDFAHHRRNAGLGWVISEVGFTVKGKFLWLIPYQREAIVFAQYSCPDWESFFSTWETILAGGSGGGAAAPPEGRSDPQATGVTCPARTSTQATTMQPWSC